MKELAWDQIYRGCKSQGLGDLQTSKRGRSGELCFNFDSFSNLTLGRSFSPSEPRFVHLLIRTWAFTTEFLRSLSGS